MEKPLFDFITSMLYDKELKISRDNVVRLLLDSGLMEIAYIKRRSVFEMCDWYMERAKKYIDAEFNDLDKQLDLKVRKLSRLSLEKNNIIVNRDLFDLVRSCTDREKVEEVRNDIIYGYLRKLSDIGDTAISQISEWYITKIRLIESSKHSLKFYICTLNTKSLF